MLVRPILALVLLSVLRAATVAAQEQGTRITTPAPGPARVIGTQSAGCIAGAVRLPDMAPGLQTIRLTKSSFWGHPDTIAALELLGARARAAGLPDLYMGDISDPRGGPLRGGHFSHQMGIDADIWLDLIPPHPLAPPEAREDIEPHGLVRDDGRGVDPIYWRPEHITLLRLAAGLPNVDRIFVNAAIKQQLCHDVTGDRSWLRLIRPWWDHSAHMHIRFHCPAGQTGCHEGADIPAGDGCDASLAWWFDHLDAPASSSAAAPTKPPDLPAACRALLAR